MTVENEFFGSGSQDLRPPSQAEIDAGEEPADSSLGSASRSMMPRPSLRVLLRAGLRALARFPGLVFSLYLVQVAMAGAAALLMMALIQSVLGHRPLFARAMEGDLAAFLASFMAEPDLLIALFWVGVSAVAAYSVVSWFLTAGLIAVLLDAPSRRREVVRWFGSAGASNFFPFMRLALWSILPHLAVGLAAGFGVAWFDPRGQDAVGLVDLFETFGPALGPALVLHWLVATAIDYARVDLVRHPGMSSLRGLVRGFRLIARHRLALVHSLLYGIVFVGAAVLYTWLTGGGAVESLVWLVLLRQLTALVRFVAHVMLIAGQVELGCAAMQTPLGRRR